MNTTEAILQKLSWKPATEVYTRALLTAAVELRRSGRLYFNNDDVPDGFQPGDKTTVGAVFKLLTMQGIMQPWRGNVDAEGIWGGMRPSSRECNNGHRNQLYQLMNQGLAEEWLRRHGALVPARQLCLCLT